ncbi:MAG: RHS repeat-associated core domain-containing protein [Polyangiaceae bacterium]
MYDTQNRIVAEIDSSGRLYKHFVYGTRSNVPDLMVVYRNGTNVYRIVADHLGSPRRVVNIDPAKSSDILMEARYSAFGIPTLVSGSLSAVPFGFAGGMYDSDTELVRFGARDYDARFGRWTHKDPILFGGGQANLYVYVGNDPVNRIDPSGLEWGDSWMMWSGGTIAGVGGFMLTAVAAGIVAGTVATPVGWGLIAVGGGMMLWDAFTDHSNADTLDNSRRKLQPSLDSRGRMLREMNELDRLERERLGTSGPRKLQPSFDSRGRMLREMNELDRLERERLGTSGGSCND